MNTKSTLLIGAGGVSSYLVPAFIKTFPDDPLIIMDGDRLEKKNLDRQLFDEQDIGKYKATALADKYGCVAVNEYFEPSKFVEPANISKIVCAVDNHVARNTTLRFSNDFRSWGIPSFIGANEYWTSQAFVFHPSLDDMYCDWDGTQVKPWPIFKYPEINTDKSQDPTNPSCVEQQESDPQLAGVNMITASLIMQLLLRWSSVDLQLTEHLPTEFQTTFGATQTQQLKDHNEIKRPERKESEAKSATEDDLLFA
jgi:hypothetical protein